MTIAIFEPNSVWCEAGGEHRHPSLPMHDGVFGYAHAGLPVSHPIQKALDPGSILVQRLPARQ